MARGACHVRGVKKKLSCYSSETAGPIKLKFGVSFETTLLAMSRKSNSGSHCSTCARAHPYFVTLKRSPVSKNGLPLLSINSASSGSSQLTRLGNSSCCVRSTVFSYTNFIFLHFHLLRSAETKTERVWLTTSTGLHVTTDINLSHIRGTNDHGGSYHVLRVHSCQGHVHPPGPVNWVRDVLPPRRPTSSSCRASCRWPTMGCAS